MLFSPPQSLRVCSNKSLMLSNHLILCQLLLPSIFPSIRVFSNELALHVRWPKYWSCSFSNSPSNEYSGLISFRIDWFDLLAVQGTLKSLLQHHNLKASIHWCLAFFRVQLFHLYMTTGKTIALTTHNFTGKVMSLLFNTLPRFVIPFFPRSQCLLISRLKSLSAVILKFKKIKSVTASTFPPSVWEYEVMGLDTTALSCFCFYVEFQTNFFILLFYPIRRLFSFSSLSAFRVVSFAHLMLLIFLRAILIPARNSSSLAYI